MFTFWIGIGIIAFLLMAACPIFLSLAVGATFLALVYVGLPLESVPHLLFNAIDSYIFVAIPLFLLAGNLMTVAGPSRRLVRWVDSLVGHLPGGLAIVTVVSCMFFAALTGSSPATAAAIGAVMVGEMVKLGYERRFCLGLVAAAGTLGILIPPSIPMIMYCTVTDVSIAELFMAGFLPGVLLGGILTAVAIMLCIRGKFGVHAPAAWSERGKRTVTALPTLVVPFIVLGGIYGGIFTPTEAAGIACLCAFVLGTFVYRELTGQKLWRALVSTVNTTCMIFMIICCAILFGKALTFAMVPHLVTELIAEAGLTWWMLLLGINILYLFMGMVLETSTIIYVTVPIFMASLVMLDIDLIHFGIILIVNIELALVTPPIGFNLYILVGATEGATIGDVVRGAIPFIGAMICGLLFITYCPVISLILPSIFFS